MADAYVSEVKYLGNKNEDFIEVALDEGTDPATVQIIVYNPGGSVRSTNDLETYTGTEYGSDIYVIDTTASTTFNGLNKAGAVAVVDDGVVVQFISFDDAAPVTASAGPANGLTSDQIGQAGSGESLETTDGGATYDLQTTPNSGTIPCFVAGARIRTPRGDIKVEDLKVGDLVMTRDRGARPIRWIASTTLGAKALRRNPEFLPIRIRKGALGHGLPERTLRVSRQHRMMLCSEAAGTLLGHTEYLVPAIKLRQMRGVGVQKDLTSVTYYHLLFDQHEILWSEGALTESFYCGARADDVLGTEQVNEIEQLFPGLLAKLAAEPARPIVERQKLLAQLAQ